MKTPLKAFRGFALPAVLLFALTVFLPQLAQAQECPGQPSVMVNNAAKVTNTAFMTGQQLRLFIGAGCTNNTFGSAPAAACASTNATNMGYLRAVGVSLSTGQGCTFVCPGGTCQVRGVDALPVELMEFDISD